MISFKVNEEEVALLNAYRLLTTRQRQMILQGIIGVTSACQPRLATVMQIAPQPELIRTA